MKLSFKVAFIAATVLIATSAFASSAVGAWKGKLNVDTSGMKGVPPDKKKMVDEKMGAVRKIAMNLSVKANKTYTLDVTGAPDGNHKLVGTWSQSGNKVTMIGQTEDGKPVKSGDKTMNLVLSSNGKAMSMDLPAQGGVKVSLAFRR